MDKGDEVKRLREENEELKQDLCHKRRKMTALKQLTVGTLRGGRGRSVQSYKLDRQEWNDDKEILTAAVEGGHMCWYNLPERWLNDDKMVVASVRSRHQEWCDLPESWRNNPDVVNAMLETYHQYEYEFPDWMELAENCRSNPAVMLAALKRGLDGLNWEDIPDDVKQSDKRLIVYGVENKGWDPDAYPCLLDSIFMKQQFLGHCFPWSRLPTVLRNDIGFARSIETFPDGLHAEQLFRHFPHLPLDRAMWGKVLESMKATRLMKEKHPFKRVLETFAPQQIRSARFVDNLKRVEHGGMLVTVLTILAS